MSARRGAPRKKARAAETVDDRPVDKLDTLFQPEALPKALQGLTEPDVFLTSSASAASQARLATKHIFDYGHINEAQPGATGPLPAMVVDGFDAEQIWQEIKLQNDAVLKYAQRTLDKLSWREQQAERESQRATKRASADEEQSKSEDEGAGDDEDVDGEPDEILDEGSKEELSDDGDRRAAAASSAEGAAAPPRKDIFFNLAEMAEFLEDAERRATAGDGGDIGDEEDDDEDGSDAANIRYEDFFDAPTSKVRMSDRGLEGGEDEDEDEEDSAMLGRGGQRDGSEDDEDKEEREEGEEGSEADGGIGAEDDSEVVNDESESAGPSEGEDRDEEDDAEADKSRFELDRERLAVRITKLEEVNISEKPWTLLGEATSKSRPVGSLLEEEVDYETASKQVPVITPEVTKSLEELIKSRVKQAMFDDPIRKTEADLPKFRPKVQLDEEKSKKGLGELYEEEYLRQTSAVGEKTDKTNPQHDEINALFKKLTYKLDALSNFHYTPKPPKEELKVARNVPAIRMEEVLPIAVSKGDTLAPQEVYAHKKVATVGESEMTHDDRKRKRKKIKEGFKKRQQEVAHRKKVREAIDPSSKNQASEKQVIADIKKSKNVVVGKKTASSKETKSTSFFTKLQEQTQATSKAPAQALKDKFAAQASFLKL